MSGRNDRMIEFRIIPSGTRGKLTERVYMRLSQIMCLMPDHHEVRTVEHGWTLTVFHEDWDKVERAFRNEYLGGKVHAV